MLELTLAVPSPFGSMPGSQVCSSLGYAASAAFNAGKDIDMGGDFHGADALSIYTPGHLANTYYFAKAFTSIPELYLTVAHETAHWYLGLLEHYPGAVTAYGADYATTDPAENQAVRCLNTFDADYGTALSGGVSP
jgi:hypothetical protein